MSRAACTRQPVAGEHPPQRRDHGRNRAEQTLRLPHRMGEVRAEQGAVDERRQIAFGSQHSGADARHRDEHHRGPVPHQDDEGDDRLSAARCSFGQPGHCEIHESKALEYAQHPERRPMQRRRSLDGVEQQPEAKQHAGPADDMAMNASHGVAASRQGDGHCGAHREQQEREDEVRGRPAVPGGMVERPVDRFPVAWCADQDHGGDAEAAKHVEGVETPASRR